jgi:hypothetical protein
VLLVAVGSLIPASAASAATTSTSEHVPLLVDVTIPATVANPAEEIVVLGKQFTLRAGESRRVTDHLELTLSSEEGAEVDNAVVCWFLDPNAGWQQVGDRSSSGTNHQGSDAGSVVLSNSLLLQASAAGTYECEIRSYTSDGRTDYHATAVKGSPFTTTGTWMSISAADEAGSHAWWSTNCDSKGTSPDCVYLGASGDPISAYVFQTPGVPPDLWSAGNDTTEVDVVGTIQVTSCPHGTRSCTSDHWGDDGIFGKTKYADIDSYLGFDQLNPDGTLCRLHQSFDPDTANWHTITNAVHHLPITYHLTAPVSPNCKGSRMFAVKVYMRWLRGNPVKIDGGTVNVINRVRTSTATVPSVLGAGEDQAAATLQAQGFTATIVKRIVDPAPPGTVIEQNSPAGTVEPAGSPVDLTLSLGRAIVPDVRGDFEAHARHSIVAANLTVGTVSHPNTCVDPGTVSLQSPAPGTHVVPGTSVNLTVPKCSGGEPK